MGLLLSPGRMTQAPTEVTSARSSVSSEPAIGRPRLLERNYFEAPKIGPSRAVWVGVSSHVQADHAPMDHSAVRDSGAIGSTCVRVYPLDRTITRIPRPATKWRAGKMRRVATWDARSTAEAVAPRPSLHSRRVDIPPARATHGLMGFQKPSSPLSISRATPARQESAPGAQCGEPGAIPTPSPLPTHSEDSPELGGTGRVSAGVPLGEQARGYAFFLR
jgi:hypothetical protein